MPSYQLALVADLTACIDYLQMFFMHQRIKQILGSEFAKIHVSFSARAFNLDI